MPRRCPSRSPLLPLQPLDLGQERSRFARICWIWLLSGPHCGDWPLNSAKEAAALATQALRLLAETVELGLLLRRRVLVALDLVRLGGIDRRRRGRGGELAFEPQAGLAAPAGILTGILRCGRRHAQNRTGRPCPVRASDFAMPVTVMNWSPTRSLQSTMEAAEW
jgi:hypothetical protein